MRSCFLWAVSVGVLCIARMAFCAELGVSLASELAYPINTPNEAHFSGEPQTWETALALALYGDASESLSYTVRSTLFYDIYDHLEAIDDRPENYGSMNGPIFHSRHARLALSEAYLDFSGLGGLWRIGKQQIVWGQADGLKVLDMVNPQKLETFILDDPEDSRIPLWTVNAEFQFSMDVSLQALVIPDLTFNENADRGSPYQVTSPQLVPTINGYSSVFLMDVERPDSNEWEYGLRLSVFYAGWDIRVNYLRHFHDREVYFQSVDGGALTLAPRYEKNHLSGFTASNAVGDVTFRTEVGYSTDTFHLLDTPENGGVWRSPEVSSVVGIDYQGISNVLLSYQWFASRLTRFHAQVVRARNVIRHSFMIRYDVMNDTLTAELFALHSDDNSDGMIRPSVSYQLNDELNLWGGLDFFYGEEAGVFGQFDRRDRIVAGAKYSF